MGYKQLILVILLLIGFATPLKAEEFPWTPVDIGMQIITTAYLEYDREQTSDIHNHPDIHETNKILGKHPSQGNINTYFAACAVGHAVVSHYLPQGVYALTGNRTIAEYSRTVWQAVWIGVEYNTTESNYKMGLKANF